MAFFVRRWTAIATVVSLALSAMPMTASAADPLPLSGTADVTAVDGTVTIDLAYRSGDPITRFKVSLAGPSFNGVLFETVDAPNEVAWSGSRAALVPGVYTVTVTADVRRAGGTVSGSA